MIARSQQLVDALGGTGLKLQVGLDHLVANLLVANIDRLGSFMAAVMLIKDVHDIGQSAADKLMDQRIINRDPQLGSARLPCLDAQTLGIDQRSVHVKNYSLDHIGPLTGLHYGHSSALYKLVYNVYSILHYRYIGRSHMTSCPIGL